MPDFHHFSICNQNQSISILVIFRQNTKVIALLFGQKCLIFITFQSAIKINQFQILVIFRQNTKVIALLFGQKCLIFITFQSAIKINQFQFFVIFRQNTKVIALLFGQKCLIFITFNLQSKSINFNFGHFSAKYQGYSLTFWPEMPDFHHFSICNQNQSISILIIFRQNTKVIALLFGQKCLIFITFQSAIKINQFQFFVIFRQNTKVIALLFGQKCLIFITFQSAIKINQFQCWSFVGKIPRL